MRSFPRALRFWTALLLACWWSVLHVAPAAAALAPSRVSGETAITSSRDADLLVVQRALEHKLVAQKLRDYGVTPEAAQLRVAAMSDQDLHALATASKGLPSGGDDAIGALVTILIIILLVIVILKLVNKQIVVK